MSKMMDTYARQPVTFEKGEGVWLWAKDGKKYLDALSGVAVNGLGHAASKISESHSVSKYQNLFMYLMFIILLNKKN